MVIQLWTFCPGTQIELWHLQSHGEAKAELEALHMQENHQATKYFIKFTQLTAHIQWGKAALLWQAYNSLMRWIKDNTVHHETPTTLTNLRKLI